MSWLDIGIIVVLAFFTLIGLRTGIIRAGFTLGGVLLGVILAGQYHTLLAEQLSPYIADVNQARIASFAIILIVVMIAANLLASWFRKMARWLLLGWVDHLGGAIFGLVVGSAICSVPLILCAQYPFLGLETAIQESSLSPIFLQYFPVLLALLPEEFDAVRQFFK